MATGGENTPPLPNVVDLDPLSLSAGFLNFFVIIKKFGTGCQLFYPRRFGNTPCAAIHRFQQLPQKWFNPFKIYRNGMEIRPLCPAFPAGDHETWPKRHGNKSISKSDSPGLPPSPSDGAARAINAGSFFHPIRSCLADRAGRAAARDAKTDSIPYLFLQDSRYMVLTEVLQNADYTANRHFAKIENPCTTAVQISAKWAFGGL